MSDVKKRTLPSWFISNETTPKKSKDVDVTLNSVLTLQMQSTDPVQKERFVELTGAKLENTESETNSSNSTATNDTLVVSDSLGGVAGSLLPAYAANSSSSNEQIDNGRICQTHNSAACDNTLVVRDSVSGTINSLLPENIVNTNCSNEQIFDGCQIAIMNASSSVLVGIDEISSTTCDTPATTGQVFPNQSQIRPICAYEPNCYRKNEEHRLQFSHHDDDNGKPTCIYGALCYRKNEDHKRAFSHNKPSTVRSRHVTTLPPPRRRGRPERDTDSDSDNEDDDIDSFLNDSSTDFEPTTDEDDEDVSDEGEPESIKRLLKESKKFAPGK